MRLGGTVAGDYANPAQWEELLDATRFRAVTAPFDCRTPKAEVDRYLEICRKRDVVIAEVGVWRNPFDPDPALAAENLEYAVGQLRLADEVGVPCCVNIVGTDGADGWDAADRSNFTPETYARILDSIRHILDAAAPKRAFYCIEPMPWMVPDGPEEYLRLLEDVNRPQFAAHMDFVNMINCPRRYLDAERFIDDCLRLLAPQIKSTHLKDIYLHPTRLTTLLEERAPGEGALDFVKVLRSLDRWLAKDAPVLLEHMQTAEEYRIAYDYVAAKAAEAGVDI